MELKDGIFLIVVAIALGYWLQSTSPKLHRIYTEGLAIVGIVIFASMWIWGLGYLILNATGVI